jgi:hypothetical protein
VDEIGRESSAKQQPDQSAEDRRHIKVKAGDGRKAAAVVIRREGAKEAGKIEERKRGIGGEYTAIKLGPAGGG